MLLTAVLVMSFVVAAQSEDQDDEDDEFVGDKPERKGGRGAIKEVVFGSEGTGLDAVEDINGRKQTPRRQLKEASTIASPVLTFKR